MRLVATILDKVALDSLLLRKMPSAFCKNSSMHPLEGGNRKNQATNCICTNRSFLKKYPPPFYGQE